MSDTRKWLSVSMLVIAALASQARAGVVAYWSFDDTLNDTSGFGSPLDLTQPGTTNTGGFHPDVPPGYGGKSWNLASGPSYVYATPLSNTKLELQTLTIDVWVNTPATAGATQLICAYEPMGTGGDGRGFYMAVSNGLISFVKGNATGSFHSITSNSAITANTWYHLTANYTAATQIGQIWIDGVLDKSAVVNAAQPSISYVDAGPGNGPDPKTFYVGAFHDNSPTGPGTGNFTSGMTITSTTFTKIDELTILDVAVPEPASAGVLCLGGVLTVFRRRRR